MLGKSFLPSICLEPPPVYFMHIPKTAGKSLSKLLSSAYSFRDVLAIKVPDQFIQVSLAELPGFRCYLCHSGIGLYELVNRSDLLCITMLRNPVERVISQFYYHQRRLTMHPEQFTPSYREKMTWMLQADLRTYLDSENFSPLHANGQCTFLGVAYDYRPFLKDGTIGSSGQPLLRPLEPQPLTETSDLAQIAANARKRLESMAVVGLTEHFAESALLICNLLGIPYPRQMPHANVGPKKTQVDIHHYRTITPPDLIERIELLTSYDQELYVYACELFEQQWARYQACPKRTYSLAPPVRQVVRWPFETAARVVKNRYPKLTQHPWLHSIKRVIRHWL